MPGQTSLRPDSQIDSRVDGRGSDIGRKIHIEAVRMNEEDLRYLISDDFTRELLKEDDD